MAEPNKALSATQWKARVEKLQKELLRLDEYHGESLKIIDRVTRSLVSGSRIADPALQPALSKLLAAVKDSKPITQVSTQSDALSRRIDDLMQADAQKNQQTAKTLVDLLERLQEVVPSGQSKTIKSLKREIEQSRKKHEDRLHQLHHDFLQRYAEVALPVDMQGGLSLGAGAQSASSTNESLWQRVLGLFQSSAASSEREAPPAGASTNDAATAAEHAKDVAEESQPAAIEPSDNAAGIKHAAQEAGGSARSSGIAGVATLDLSPTASQENPSTVSYDEVGSILLGLLADIDEPESAKVLVKDLYGRLENGVTESSLIEVLDDSVEVVSLVLTRDQSDFAEFLDGLDDKLLEFSQFVSELTEELGNNKQRGEQLEQDVGSRLGAIRTSAQKANSIDELKQQVEVSVDQASTLLSSFVANQKDNVAALEQKAIALQQQVEALQKESEKSKQALAKQREKLFRDKLTEIPNREAYEHRVSDEFARWQRYKRPLSYGIADIDFFKAINDNFGHAAGDKVLSLVAKIIQTTLRESDFVARYGGEEFVILLPETTAENAKLTLEKVREAIITSPFNFNKQPVNVSCSFGVTEFADGDDISKVFERADAALYKAKDTGRNRVLIG